MSYLDKSLNDIKTLTVNYKPQITRTTDYSKALYYKDENNIEWNIIFNKNDVCSLVTMVPHDKDTEMYLLKHYDETWTSVAPDYYTNYVNNRKIHLVTMFDRNIGFYCFYFSLSISKQ